MKKVKKKAILLPAFNEEKTIVEVVEKCKKTIPDAFILVVDDGSTDKTAELAKKAGAHVISHEKNMGKGEALKTGFKYLLSQGFENIVIMDADGQYSPEFLPMLFSALDQADIVMGSRDFSSLPFRHRLGNIVWRSLFNFLFSTKFRDTNCGVIGFRKNALKVILDEIGSGYTIENSVLISALRNGLRIIQLPVKVKYLQTSGIIRGVKIVASVSWYILKEGIKYRFSASRKKVHRG